MRAVFLYRAALKAGATIGLTLLATVAWAQDHSHHDAPASALALNHGKKWASDEVLRRDMDNIRRAISANRSDIEQGRLDSEDYRRLADVVDQQAADIVKNCKLSKDADAAFHAILRDLLNDAQLMRTSPKVQAQQIGALGVVQSLHNYGMYFQHPGWQVEAPKTR